MPQEDIIAARYARGLAEQAAGENRMDAVRHDLELLVALLDREGTNPAAGDFAAFLASPAVPMNNRRRAAAAIMEKCGADPLVADFLGVLVRHRRVDLVSRIYPAFCEAADALTGERTAVVRTAMPLTGDQESRLAAALASALGVRVRVRQVVDPGLLAGAKVSIGDRSFDGSIRGKLDRLRRTLAGRFENDAADAGNRRR
ncbi:MAG: ATP synthase F1 subunit delta [Planctomycetota bacterium]|jgi:F-type H+-transporting ATPase subunit delta|nr:ATP synthase F1 subunit delta [Planctomycetota bacterium]